MPHRKCIYPIPLSTHGNYGNYVLILILRANLVQDPQVRSSSLHNPLPIYLHTYIWPFGFIWSIFLAFYLSPQRYEKHIQSSEWTFVWAGAIVTVQSLTWLSTHWSVWLKSTFTSTAARDINSAQLIKVIPVANAGSAEICRLVRDKVGFFILPGLAIMLTVEGRGSGFGLFLFSEEAISV